MTRDGAPTRRERRDLARPSGTQVVHEIYAESFISEAHLGEVRAAAREVVSEALSD